MFSIVSSRIARRTLGIAPMLPLAAATMLLGGCLIGSSSDIKTSGAYVGPQTFSQIEEGVTNTEWLTATLGEPTSKSTMTDGREIWKWTYTRTKSGSGSVLFLYGGSDRSETQGAAFVELRDGVVTKKWRD